MASVLTHPLGMLLSTGSKLQHCYQTPTITEQTYACLCCSMKACFCPDLCAAWSRGKDAAVLFHRNSAPALASGKDTLLRDVWLHLFFPVSISLWNAKDVEEKNTLLPPNCFCSLCLLCLRWSPSAEPKAPTLASKMPLEDSGCSEASQQLSLI